MSYESHFNSKFKQGQAMDMALSLKGKDKGKLKAQREGVCEVLSLLWLRKTRDLGPEEAFKFVAGMRGNAAAQGFYRQVMGAQRDLPKVGDLETNLTATYQMLCGSGSLSLKLDTYQPVNVSTYLTSHNMLCLLALHMTRPASGHATTAYGVGGSWVFFDPNLGQADVTGAGLTQLLIDCHSYYVNGGMCFNNVAMQVYQLN